MNKSNVLISLILLILSLSFVAAVDSTPTTVTGVNVSRTTCSTDADCPPIASMTGLYCSNGNSCSGSAKNTCVGGYCEKSYGENCKVCENGCDNGICLPVGNPKVCSMPACTGGEAYDTGKTDSNGCKVYSCTSIACSMPACAGAYSTGKTDSNGCEIYQCPSIPCASPVCSGSEAYDTGKTDSRGCVIYICPSNPVSPTTPGMDTDMSSCLVKTAAYWDQETNTCKTGYSDSIIKSTCSDPDGGINVDKIAHTFGFRSYYADELDKRIRTGGKDSCLPDNQMVEHYCDSNGFIQTMYIKCEGGCVNDECKGAIVPAEPAPSTPGQTEPIQYKDGVKCVFKDSKQIQKCYSADDKGYTCSGQETCIIPVTGGELGSIITWKSSCGGYAYTTIDNDNDYAEFYCGDQNQIQVENFRYVKYQCSNGERMVLGSESSCKSKDLWAQYALESCIDKCDSEGRCTVLDDLNFGGACGTTVVINPTEQPIQVEAPSIPGSTVTCTGCFKDDKCYPIGYRKSGEYCTDSSAFVVQSQEDAKCDNSFECESNVCVSDKCISSSLIQKIISWFGNLFG